MPGFSLDGLLEKAKAAPGLLDHAEMVFLLGLSDRERLDRLCRAAYEVKLRHTGRKVSLRGLIEMGNLCSKNCYYCGIRRSNTNVNRFQLDADAVVRMAKWAYDAHYGSVAIQSGEIESETHTRMIEDVLHRIADFSDGKMGVTLSLGEQTDDVFRRWHKAGAHRYLLRIETSNHDLYRKLHPADHDFERRSRCLDVLHDLGYQVGSGVMSGLPGQTLDDLADDVEFFRKKDLDMIGMGPWLPHPDTPLGAGFPDTAEFRAGQLLIGLKMIAVTRLYLHDTNIASTTALQTLAPDGREQGLLAGGNVIMPNVTDTAYRRSYQLYTGKPSLDENSESSRDALTRSIAAVGEEINWDLRGDSPHYFAR